MMDWSSPTSLETTAPQTARCLVAALALLAAVALACSGGSDRQADKANPGREAFPGVPVPAGANEKDRGNVGALPFGVPGSTVDPAAFTSLEFRTYEVDNAPEDVIDFYHGELDGWEEISALSVGGETGGGFGVWTRGDDTALWVGARPKNGVTELIVILGSSE